MRFWPMTGCGWIYRGLTQRPLRKRGGENFGLRIAEWFESRGKLLNSECCIVPLGVCRLAGVRFRIPQIRNPQCKIRKFSILFAKERTSNKTVIADGLQFE
jgi:hypothetical protein